MTALPKMNSRRLLLGTTLCALTLVSKTALAGTLVGQQGQVAPGDAPESWNLTQGAVLNVLPGANILDLVALESTVLIQGASAQASGTTLSLRNGSIARITGGASVISTAGAAIATSNDGGAGSGARSFVTVENSSVIGATAGVSLASHAQFSATGSSIQATGPNGIGISVFSADVLVAGNSSVTGQQNGIRLQRDDRGEVVLPSLRNVTIDASTVRGVAGSGILVNTFSTRSGATDGTILLRNGAEVSGGNGVAIELAENTTASITSYASRIVGDVRVADGSSATLSMASGAVMQGAMTGNIAATVNDAIWNVTGDSDVSSLTLNGGAINFASRGDDHSNLLVRGDFAGTGGSITLNTVMNAGGPLSAQATDRLLIQGDVTTTGTTLINIAASGAGANTDTNGNDRPDANEGISLVQVAGNSRRDAFALGRGSDNYGGFKLGLTAFAPGESDPSQSVLPSSPASFWDYRVHTISCTKDGCDPVTPEPPEPPITPEPPVNPPEVREGVASQVPAYLTLGLSLFNYNDQFGGLRQRLGDIRSGTASDPLGGEVFARYIGGQSQYSANRSFANYGYDFDQQINAFQMGASLINVVGDNGVLRAGWAFDHGTTRLSPHAVDGHSSSKLTANGFTGWLTWQHDSGWWVDGVVTGRRFVGDVGTDELGKDMARVHASSWVMSVETGMPFALGGEWTVEPRFQLVRQNVAFRDFADADGLDVKLGSSAQTSATVGALLSRTINPKLVPYARVDLTHTVNGTSTPDLTSEAWNVSNQFATGRTGNAVRVAAGLTSQLTPHVQLYGEGNYQHYVGNYGMRGWSGNAGIRLTF